MNSESILPVAKLFQGAALLVILFGVCVGCGPSEPEYDYSGNETAASAGSQGQSQISRAMPKSASIFREHQVTDPGMNNTVASTILVPDGWKIEGGMTRPNPQYYMNPFLLDISFTAPDGRQVHIFPSLSFEFNYNYPLQAYSPTANGYFYMDLPQSPGAWLMDWARQQPREGVSNLRFVSEEQEVELTNALRRNNSQAYQMVQQNQYMGAQTGISMEFDTQATVVVIQYMENGIELEESILVGWQYFLNYWQGRVTGGYWSVSTMCSFRGPVGSDYLNDPQLMAIMKSLRPNPVWVNEMNKFWAEMSRIKNKGRQDRMNQNIAANRKLSQTLSETSDIIANGWAARNTISDSAQSSYVDSIHQVTPYTTTGGDTVRLPSFYDHVYTDGNGGYILNNDALYNPNLDSSVNSQNWSRISPSQ
ncbi:hypothetical protein MLD52_18595 [Puniceicoccaceae bacterium K14]|nr:hypothetical protein [Puniceicoccaceae bacterium K14]